MLQEANEGRAARKGWRCLAWAIALPLLLASTDDHVRVGLTDDIAIESYAYCLPSGLRVMFEPRPGRADLSLVMVIDAGSRADPPGQEGMAHLVEHLWFRTAHLSSANLYSLQETTGAQLNGVTQVDTVAFTTLGARQHVRALLQIEGERLLDPLASLDEAAFEVEREIVRNEFRQKVLDPRVVSVAPLFESLFPEGHPYAHPGYTSHESLDRITLVDAKAFAAAHYMPENAALLVQGDFTETTFRGLLGSLPEASREAPASGPRLCGARNIETLPTPRSGIRVVKGPQKGRAARFGWMFPPGLQQTALAKMAIDYGSDFIADRLDRQVVCQIEQLRHASVVSCELALHDGETAEDTVNKGLVALPDAWDPLVRHNVDARFRAWAKDTVSDLLLSLEGSDNGVESRALREVEWFQATGEVGWFARSIEVTHMADFAKSAQDFGRAWFTKRPVTIVQIEPGGSTTDVPWRDVHAERAVDTRSELGQVDLTRLQQIIARPDLSRMEGLTLSNGLRALLVPMGNLPIVRTALLLPGGSARLEHGALDELAWAMVASPSGLPDPSEWVAGRWTQDLGWSVWSLGVDGGNVEGQLALLRMRVDDALALRLQAGSHEEWLQRARIKHNSLQELAEAFRWRHLAPDLPQWWFDPEAVVQAPLRRRDIEDWIATVLRPDGATLLVVGRFDPAVVRASIERRFSSWRSRRPEPGPVRIRALSTPGPDEVKVFPLDGTTQTTLTLACRLGEVDETTAGLVATWVRSELRQELREDTGQTYGVNTEVNWLEHGLELDVETRVPIEVGAKAVQRLREQVRAGGEVDQAELDRLKLATARSMAHDLQSTAAVLDGLAREVAMGQEVHAMSHRAERLVTADLAQFHAALAPCAGHEIVTVIGPQGIGSELRGMGISAEDVQWRGP